MDDAFYQGLAVTAAGLIERFGQPCMLSREGSGGGIYNPDTSTTTDVLDAQHAGNAAKFDYETDDIDGTNIVSGDVRFLIGFDIGTEPKSGDLITLTRHNERFKVVSCKPLDPGGVAVIYEVQARK